MKNCPDMQMEKHPGCLSVRLTGPLDLVLGEKLISQLKSAMISVRNLVIDLSGVNYLDSSGLGALVSIQMTLKRQGGTLILANLQGAPLEVLKSSQLLKILQIRDTVEEALAELQSGGTAESKLAEE